MVSILKEKNSNLALKDSTSNVNNNIKNNLELVEEIKNDNPNDVQFS
jgi:hypothetical protein